MQVSNDVVFEFAQRTAPELYFLPALWTSVVHEAKLVPDRSYELLDGFDYRIANPS